MVDNFSKYMQRDQINLSNKSLKANKAFLTALYGADDLKGARKWFDKLDYSVPAGRQRDEGMTLDSFLDLMNDSYHIMLQIGSPFPDRIRYCASSIGESVNRFAWVECPLTESNYEVVSRLFEEGKK